MKTLFKILGLSCLLSILSTSALTAQDSSEILKIQKQYNLWQKVLSKETPTKGKKIFKISMGEKFGKTEWVAAINQKVDENTECFLWADVTFIKDDKLGSVFYIYETSPLDDSSYTAEHYYWPTGELFYVYWRSNIFVSIDPQTGGNRPLMIVQRFYLNKEGRVIRFLESMHKIDEEIKVENENPNYTPPKVTYWKNIKALPFYHLLNE